MKKKKPGQKKNLAENQPQEGINQKGKTNSPDSALAIQKEISRKLKELSARLSQKDNNLKKRIRVPAKLLTDIKKSINDKNLELLN
jgi:hypothetical protein